MKRIPLTNGKEAIVDDEDFDRLNELSWHSQQDEDTGNWYAVHSFVKPDGKSRGAIRMHRMILNADDLSKVDHIDFDGLNNQKLNLRLATDSQNQANRRLNKDSRSGLKGVHFHKRDGKWYATLAGKWLGYYPDKILAALAYDKAALEKYGEFAKTNASLSLI